MRENTGKILLLLSAVLSLFGCTEFGPLSDIPKPFQTQKGTYDMSRVAMAGHIVVGPVAGMPQSLDLALRTQVADNLLDLGIIATTAAPPQRTSFLRGKIPDEQPPIVIWTLLDPHGVKVREFTTPISFDVLQQGPATDQALKVAAGLVAENFASTRALRAAPPKASPPQTTLSSDLNEDVYGDVNLPPLFLLPILGAPGKGNQELDRAIRRALQDRQVVLNPSPGPEEFQLQCVVVLVDVPGGASQISLYWELKTPKGLSVASVDQSNIIESGSLDGTWGPTADLVAATAADSLVDFLARATRKTQ